MNDGEEGGRRSPEGSAPGSSPENLAFRYNRERRLEKAPESVRWLASRYGAKPSGFLKNLFATRASRLLFFTVVAFVVAFNIAPLFTGPRGSGKLLEDRYSVKAFWFEGKVFVSVAREGPVSDEEGGGDLGVSARIEGGANASATFAVGLATTEDFRLAIESSSGKPELVELRLTRGGSALDLATKVE